MSNGVSERGATRYADFRDYLDRARLRTGPRPKLPPGYGNPVNSPLIPGPGKNGVPDYRLGRDIRKHFDDLEKARKRIGLPKGGNVPGKVIIGLLGRSPIDEIGDIGSLLARGDTSARLHHGTWVLQFTCPSNGRPQWAASATNVCNTALTTSTYPSAGYQVGWAFPGTGTGVVHNRLQVRTNPALADNAIAAKYTRAAAGMAGAWYMPRPEPWSDPNIMRDMPSIKPDVGTAVLTETNTAVSPETSSSAAPPQQSRVFDETGFNTYFPVRSPPGGRTKERKFLSRSKRLMIALFKALDVVSEYSEIIDAFYEALPSDIKARYKALYGGRDGGLVDNAGQYGIDGADWKLLALYDHFGEVDVTQAVKNIINNHLQDQLLGAINKSLPKNIGRANDGGMKAINDLFQQGWDQVVG